MAPRLPYAIALVLACTLTAGIATAATRSSDPAKACVNSHGDLRLLVGSKCPKGDRLTTVGQRGPRGRAARPEHDYVTEAGGQTDLATTKNALKTVLGLDSLPAGTWAFSTEATVVNFGRADYFRCKIVIGSQQIASGASTVGTPVGAGGMAGVPSAASTVANIGLIGTAVEPKRFTAFLQCWHDLDTKGATAYIDPGAVMLARPVGTISGHTS